MNLVPGNIMVHILKESKSILLMMAVKSLKSVALIVGGKMSSCTVFIVLVLVIVILGE